jgi:hypothetical protein
MSALVHVLSADLPPGHASGAATAVVKIWFLPVDAAVRLPVLRVECVLTAVAALEGPHVPRPCAQGVKRVIKKYHPTWPNRIASHLLALRRLASDCGVDDIVNKV